jgi:hypothetical protein
LTRLAPVRHRWDLAVLANLEGGIERPVDLLEVINNQGFTDLGGSGSARA